MPTGECRNGAKCRDSGIKGERLRNWFSITSHKHESDDGNSERRDRYCEDLLEPAVIEFGMKVPVLLFRFIVQVY